MTIKMPTKVRMLLDQIQADHPNASFTELRALFHDALACDRESRRVLDLSATFLVDAIRGG